MRKSRKIPGGRITYFKAKPRKLKVKWTIEVQQPLIAVNDPDLEEELTKMFAEQIVQDQQQKEEKEKGVMKW